MLAGDLKLKLTVPNCQTFSLMDDLQYCSGRKLPLIDISKEANFTLCVRDN